MDLSTMENKTHSLEDMEYWNSYFRHKLIPTGVLLGVYFLTGTIGNVLVLYIHLFKMPRNDNRYFITFLSGVNLVASCGTTVFFFTLIFFNLNYPSDIMCKTFFFLTVSFVVESAGLIVIIAVQRYLKLCKPYSRRMTDKHKRIAILASIVTSLLMGIPCFYSSGTGPHGTHLNISGTYCWIRTEHYPEIGVLQTAAISVLLGTFFICSCLLYRKIGKVLMRLSARRRERSKNGQSMMAADRNEIEAEASFIQSEPTTDHAERRVKKPIHVNFYRMFLTMFCLYVLVSIPTTTMLVISHFDHSLWFGVEGGVDINVIHILQDMFILKFSADPFIYGYFDVAFRQKVIEICKCK